MVSKLKRIAVQALGRAEQLKKAQNADSTKVIDKPSSSCESPRALHRGNSVQLMVSGDATYSEEEKKVLTTTSWINKHEYVPFMSIDLNERCKDIKRVGRYAMSNRVSQVLFLRFRFHYCIPFTDRDGLLELSPKQKSKFVKWARPDEFCLDPKIVVGEHVNYASIKQTVCTLFLSHFALYNSYDELRKPIQNFESCCRLFQIVHS